MLREQRESEAAHISRMELASRAAHIPSASVYLCDRVAVGKHGGVKVAILTYRFIPVSHSQAFGNQHVEPEGSRINHTFRNIPVITAHARDLLVWKTFFSSPSET